MIEVFLFLQYTWIFFICTCVRVKLNQHALIILHGRSKDKTTQTLALGPSKNKFIAINICILSICAIKDLTGNTPCCYVWDQDRPNTLVGLKRTSKWGFFVDKKNGSFSKLIKYWIKFFIFYLKLIFQVFGMQDHLLNYCYQFWIFNKFIYSPLLWFN